MKKQNKIINGGFFRLDEHIHIRHCIHAWMSDKKRKNKCAANIFLVPKKYEPITKRKTHSHTLLIHSLKQQKKSENEFEWENDRETWIHFRWNYLINNDDDDDYEEKKMKRQKFFLQNKKKILYTIRVYNKVN